MSKTTKDALRNARYNFAITELDVRQCQRELRDAQSKLERALGAREITETVLAHAIVDHGASEGDAGISRIDEREADFEREQARLVRDPKGAAADGPDTVP